ncbi:MAG TPA: hypothetical protein VFE53_22190 [Mucilaginibacter sp.]|jgi:hypothetical protein|nr:hypothetical protein [Mucilaginibacter sp.]
MPNWCSNSVFFLADAEKIQQIRGLFAEIQEKQATANEFHLPDFAISENGYMLDIVLDKRSIQFETRWVPNLDLLIEIADHYDAGFVSKFQEMANGIYGEARYQDRTLTMVSLDMEDFKAIRYDKQKQGYPCGEDVFEYEGDLLDYILEQKKLNNLGVEVIVRKTDYDAGR